MIKMVGSSHLSLALMITDEASTANTSRPNLCGKQRQDAGSAAHVQNHLPQFLSTNVLLNGQVWETRVYLVREQVRVFVDEIPIGFRSNAVLKHLL